MTTIGWFDGKVALVTGAGGGIGRATAIGFAREGAKVVVSDVSAAGGQATVEAIEAAGGTAIFVKADVSLDRDVQTLVATTVSRFGRLDCAFNNAGINELAKSEWDEAVFDRSIAINLKGVMLCMKYEIEQMLKNGGGTIVNTSSINGLVGNAAQPAYTAGKHGVIGLTRTAALRYARQGIRVNAVCPGAIQTAMLDQAMAASPQAKQYIEAMTPLGRIGQPEEVAEAVLWLCSDRSSFVTGQPLAVDGGMVAQ